VCARVFVWGPGLCVSFITYYHSLHTHAYTYDHSSLVTLTIIHTSFIIHIHTHTHTRKRLTHTHAHTHTHTQQFVPKFRKELPKDLSKNTSDATCLRFLRARKMKIPAAVKMYTKSMVCVMCDVYEV